MPRYVSRKRRTRKFRGQDYAGTKLIIPKYLSQSLDGSAGKGQMTGSGAGTAWMSVPLPSQGNTTSTRLGDEVVIEAVHIKGYIVLSSQTCQPYVARMVVGKTMDPATSNAPTNVTAVLGALFDIGSYNQAAGSLSGSAGIDYMSSPFIPQVDVKILTNKEVVLYNTNQLSTTQSSASLSSLRSVKINKVIPVGQLIRWNPSGTVTHGSTFLTMFAGPVGVAAGSQAGDELNYCRFEGTIRWFFSDGQYGRSGAQIIKRAVMK